MNELIKYIQEAVNMSVVKSKLNQPYKKSKQHERTLVYEKAFSHNKSSVTTTLPFPPCQTGIPTRDPNFRRKGRTAWCQTYMYKRKKN